METADNLLKGKFIVITVVHSFDYFMWNNKKDATLSGTQRKREVTFKGLEKSSKIVR